MTSLAPGARLGAYELLSELGRGGMGVVWRARDTALRREVAIKVLPEAMARDSDRLARFEREARVLASLNHPNVAHLYGFSSAVPTGSGGETPAGESSATAPERESSPLPFLVMELVPGETLADRIGRGRLPVDEAIAIFLEIARGLESAHAKGIVHRDLKPANVKLVASAGAPSGGSGAPGVKILDFGLAKALAPELEAAGATSLSESPTLTQAATMRGEILGTAAYMSPEQARGRAVDERSDIWAFGVCLYEALTGTRLFAAEDAAGTLAKVLESQPSLDALPPETPPALRRLLRRCLVKTPAARLHHIADARLELEEAAAGATAVEDAAGLTAAARSRGTLSASGRRRLVLAAAAALALGLVGGLSLSRLAEPPAPVRQERYLIEVEGMTRERALNDGGAVATSPDGELFVLAAERDGISQLWHRRRDRLELEPILGTEQGSTPAFSPDGKWLAFATTDALAKVPAGGGLATRIASIEWLCWGLDWMEDGSIVFADDRNGLGRARIWLAPADGGPVRQVTAVDSSPSHHGHLWPAALPGGRSVVFAEWIRDQDRMRLQAADIATGELLALLPGSHPRYVSSGHLLFTRPGSLWAVPFDPDTLALLGPAARIADEVATDGITGRADYALGADGTLVYRRREASPGTRLAWKSAAGGEDRVSTPPGDYGELVMSPDGTRVALSDRLQSDLWILELETGAATRLPFENSMEYAPAWSTDGRRIAFAALGEKSGVYVAPADGSSAPELLKETPELFAPKGWIDRPAGLIGHAGADATDFDLVFLPLEGEPELQPLLATRFRETRPALSPDGRWLAYESDESGTGEIYVRPFPEVATGRWQVSRGGGEQALWAPGGDRLFYLRDDEAVAVTIRSEGDHLLVGEPRAIAASLHLTQETMGSPYAVYLYAVASDGERVLVLEDELGRRASPTASLVVVKNFASELARLAPRN